MKASEIVGRRIRVVVARTPCRVVMEGCVPLAETTEGVAQRFIAMPAGPVGIVRRDDGVLVAFDAGADIAAGRIEVELPADPSG